MFDPSISLLENYSTVSIAAISLGLVLLLSILNGPSIITFSKTNDSATRKLVDVVSTTQCNNNVVVKYSLDVPPRLHHVPSLPLVGSMIPWYSKIPLLTWGTRREWLLAIREKYGDFYSIGIPGLGQGVCGTIYCTYSFHSIMMKWCMFYRLFI